MNSDSAIFVSGHRGLLGSAIHRRLDQSGETKLITAARDELNLLELDSVLEFFSNNDIDQVYLAAAKVGGILANKTFPGEFIYENLMIQCNVIHAAHICGVQKLLFVGSSCIYPRLANQPMREDSLFSGELEATIEPYGVAKIAGIKLCESYNRQYGRDYRCVMPSNLYGPNDNFHAENTGVIPALLRRFHEATQQELSEVVVWGSGNAMREFSHVDDMADACVHVMQIPQDVFQANTEIQLSQVNIGTGVDCTIRELAETMARVTGFQGDVVFDSSKPDGAPRKLMNVSRLKAMGWQSSITLEQGLTETYKWYLENISDVRE